MMLSVRWKSPGVSMVKVWVVYTIVEACKALMRVGPTCKTIRVEAGFPSASNYYKVSAFQQFNPRIRRKALFHREGHQAVQEASAALRKALSTHREAVLPSQDRPSRHWSSKTLR